MNRSYFALTLGAALAMIFTTASLSLADPPEYEGEGPRMSVEKVIEDDPENEQLFACCYLVWDVPEHEPSNLVYYIRWPEDEDDDPLTWQCQDGGGVGDAIHGCTGGEEPEHPHRMYINGASQVIMEYTAQTKDLVADEALRMLERRLIAGELVGEWQMATWKYSGQGQEWNWYLSKVYVDAEDPCNLMGASYTASSGNTLGKQSCRGGHCPSSGAAPSYDSTRSEEYSTVGYGWRDGMDMTLKCLAKPVNSRVDSRYELNLGMRRLYLTKMDDGAWHGGGPGSDIDIDEISGQVWVRFAFHRAYIFDIPTGGFDVNDEEPVKKIIDISRKKNGTENEFEGLETQFAYDQETGKILQKITDPYGRELTYEYESGRLKQIKDDNNVIIEEFTYTANDALETYTRGGTDTTTFSYHGTHQHKLTQVTHNDGEKLFHNFTYINTISAGQDPLGVTQVLTSYTTSFYGPDDDWSNGYMVRGVCHIIDADGNYVRTKVKKRKNPSVWAVTKQYDQKSVYIYDDQNPEQGGYVELESKTQTEAGTTTYRYDSTNHRLIWSQVTDGAGYYLTTGYGYYAEGDSRDGNLKSITVRKEDSLEGQTPDVTYDYDDWDHVKEIKDVLNHQTKYQYDTYPDANTPTNMLKYTWQEFNNDGVQKNKTEYQYYPYGDANDRDFLLKKVIDSLGRATQYDYIYSGADQFFNGSIKTITDPAGRVMEFSYTKDAQGTTTTFYTVPGKNGPRTTSSTYDKLGRTTKVKYPPASPSETDVFEVDYSYTGTRLSSVQYSFGSVATKTTTYAYEPSTGWLKEVGEAVGETEETVTKYSYFVDGSVKSIESNNDTDASPDPDMNSKVGYEYDKLGRTTKVEYYVTASSTNYTTYAYYPDGSLKQSTTAKGDLIDYKYDAMNPQGKMLNLLSMVDCPGTTYDVTYSYYDNSALKTVKVGSDEAVTWTYDNYGRVTSEDGALTGTSDKTNFTAYYNNGLVNKLKYPGQATEVVYTIDALNRLTKIVDHNSQTTSFTYDNVTGDLVKTKLPNGASANYAYDDLGRLASLVNQKSASEVLTSFAYQYSNECACSMAQISRVTFEDGRTVAYDYDKLSRLLEEEYKTAQQAALNKFEYEYDEGGNRLEKKFDGDGNKVIWYASDDEEVRLSRRVGDKGAGQ
jgi:YD repeat-containing protein